MTFKISSVSYGQLASQIVPYLNIWPVNSILSYMKDDSVVSVNVPNIWVPTSSGVKAQEMKNKLYPSFATQPPYQNETDGQSKRECERAA